MLEKSLDDPLSAGDDGDVEQRRAGGLAERSAELVEGLERLPLLIFKRLETLGNVPFVDVQLRVG